jgi:hypothetical protein
MALSARRRAAERLLLLEPERCGMPIIGARFARGMVTMLDEEPLRAPGVVVLAGLEATQLFVPELTVDPSAMFEREAGPVLDDEPRVVVIRGADHVGADVRGAVTLGTVTLGTVTLGAVTLGAVTGAETEGIRMMEPTEGLIVGMPVLAEMPLLDVMTRTPDLLELDDPPKVDPIFDDPPKMDPIFDNPREELDDPREELDDPREELDDPREELDDPREELEDDWPLAGLIEDPREPR